MAPASTLPLSPAELSYLHTSLSLTPPLRPDGRAPTQFRPLAAETDILPTANGSARVCFADGTEAVVGVKAEVEKTTTAGGAAVVSGKEDAADAMEEDDEAQTEGPGRDDWVEVAIDIPGQRDDDALPTFLGAMVTEALVADGTLRDRLGINTRFHWRLYVDILLLSLPLSLPLPLLSLTTHLALTRTRLPRLVSEKDEDPLFDDDWESSTYLYPQTTPSPKQAQKQKQNTAKPPVTLLVMSVADTILFDPSRDELAVADAVVAVSVGYPSSKNYSTATKEPLQLLALRTLDPPSRLTSAGAASTAPDAGVAEDDGGWRPPVGGVKREVLGRMVEAVVGEDGVGWEVLAGLEGVVN